METVKITEFGNEFDDIFSRIIVTGKLQQPYFKIGKIVKITNNAKNMIEEGLKKGENFQKLEKKDQEIVLTPLTEMTIYALLQSHLNIEKGACCDDDHEQNLNAVKHEGQIDEEGNLMQERVFSAIYLKKFECKFWIITEYDRSETTILMPEDY